MPQRIDAPADRGLGAHTPHLGLAPDGLRDAPAVAELFLGVFARDLVAFLPGARFEPVDPNAEPIYRHGPNFRVTERTVGPDVVELYGVGYWVSRQDGSKLAGRELRMVRAMGAVLGLRYHHLFEVTHSVRLELYRGGSEDHYVAAFVEPSVYLPPARTPSRIAAAIQTLRTAALSTYENQRVSTGALLIGDPGLTSQPLAPTPPEALPYGVNLTGLKSLHRLCDGEKTLFVVDGDGRLSGIVDIGRWASAEPTPGPGEAPEFCARAYLPHARATRRGGHICVVLSPNQEIKLFAEGTQAFAFAHGRWRMLDPIGQFSSWRSAVADPTLARSLFDAALNLAEARRGALFVVVDRPDEAVGRLIAPGDLLDAPVLEPPSDLVASDPLARRALHYLARGRSVGDLDPAVLEALAGLDGALVVDRSGRLLAFGAILRNEAGDRLGPAAEVEGARTTAALIASRFGPVLKVSQDGVIAGFVDGARAWDL